MTQGVDERERSVAVDEQLGAPGERARGRRRLERPHGRGADGDDPVGGLARGHGGLRHAVPLAVHLVVLDPVGGDGPERAEADHELHGRDLQRRRPRTASSSGRGEVEPGGGRGDGLGPLGVGGLVALGVGQRRR